MNLRTLCPVGNHTLVAISFKEHLGKLTIIHEVPFHSCDPILRTFKLGSPSLSRYLATLTGNRFTAWEEECWSCIKGKPFIAQIGESKNPEYCDLIKIIPSKSTSNKFCSCNHVLRVESQSNDLKSECLWNLMEKEGH